MAFVFLLPLPLLYPVFRVLLLKERFHPVTFRLMRIYSKYILIGSLIPPKRIQADNLPDEPCIVCCNHTSYLDIPLLYAVLRRYFIFMGKAELRNWPFVGMFFKNMNIAVNRQNKWASHKAFLMAGKEIDQGHDLVIFPEGTIPQNPPNLGHFKNGAFKMAVDKQVPILPMTILDNWQRFPDGGLFSPLKPGISRVIIHEAIHPDGSGMDLINLRDRTRSILHQTLEKAYGTLENEAGKDDPQTLNEPL